MKRFFYTMALAVVISGCGSQSHQSETKQQNNTATVHEVVRNFDMKLENMDPDSEGRCGDRFLLTFSRVSDTELQNVETSIQVDGKEVALLSAAENTYTLDTRDMRCGHINITARIKADGQQDEYISKSIVLYSDIAPKTVGYKVLKTFNHDRGAYTQGLIVEGDCFYESTGLKRKSTLRKVSIDRGEVLQSVPLDDQFFGEGLAAVGDRLIQLTWQSNRIFVYDKKTFAKIQDAYLGTEGWGLATVSTDTLALTDGSENLYFLDPVSLATIKTIQVYDNAGPVERLNELEMYNGHLLANIYHSDHVAEIDYHTGKVLRYIDFKGLLPDNLRDEYTDVLNGIAYAPERDELYVTGKNWPKLYMVKIQ